MYITKAWLVAHHASPAQIRTFAREWPQGGEITEETLRRAYALGLNLDWLAEQLPCSAAAAVAYERSRAAAEAVEESSRAAAWMTYVRSSDAAKAAYDGSDAAWRAYDGSVTAAKAAYAHSTDAFWTMYVHSRAAARITALLQSLPQGEGKER